MTLVSRIRSAVFVLVCLALSSAPLAGADPVAGLLGTWVRDARESDDAEGVIREALARPQGGFKIGRSSRGSVTPGARIGPGAPRGLQPPLEERFETLASSLEVLEVGMVDRAGTLLQIVDASGRSRFVFTDERAVADGFGGQTTASLGDGALVIVTRSQRSVRVDTLRLDGERLELVSELQGVAPLPDLSIRTVYERVPDAAAIDEVARATESPKRADFPVVTTATVAETGDEAERAGEPPVAAGPVAAAEPDVAARVIRVLPPERAPGELLAGKVEVQTLTIEPAVATVEFRLDGELVARRDLPPFEAKVELADPPREQILLVAAYDGAGRELGEDVLVLNRLDPPFRVRLTDIEGERGGGAVVVSADVSVPRKARLEEVTFYLDERPVVTRAHGPFVVELPTAGAGPESFVRVVARLADGRELEDVELLEGGEFREEIDVHLVQLQVLVTDRSGRPVPGLAAEDFRVTDGGEVRPIERLYPSREVALALGLAVDSSGSMEPLWLETRSAAEEFLDGTLGPRDRAFLVDFDDRLRLLQPLTGERAALSSALDRLQARGGTALYDSILYSLLQFEAQPGRRALVVLTDGFDSTSRADPSRAIDFGRRLGVPVYVIALAYRGAAPAIPRSRGAFGGRDGFSDATLLRSELRLITDPTGGRLFQVATPEQVRAAFGQIEAELRSQYLLTYTTDRPPGSRAAPKVEVEGKGLRVKTAVPLDLAN